LPRQTLRPTSLPTTGKLKVILKGKQLGSDLSHVQPLESCVPAQGFGIPSPKKTAGKSPLTANRVKCMELLQSLEPSLAQESWVFEGVLPIDLHFFTISELMPSSSGTGGERSPHFAILKNIPNRENFPTRRA
jgi:hypothetical protein